MRSTIVIRLTLTALAFKVDLPAGQEEFHVMLARKVEVGRNLPRHPAGLVVFKYKGSGSEADAENWTEVSDKSNPCDTETVVISD